MQLEMVERSKKKVDFKEQVRLEVEVRLKREELEREAKKKAAEERRAAVVERLRKKAEEEERRKLEAEAALLRIQQEGERREQQARDRLHNDRSTMVMEDELSRLAEHDYKEQLERLLWEKNEKEKLAEFERALQARDAEEAEARKARMAALEEKKAKLAELRRLQNLSGADGAQAQQNTRQEAAKLDKQLRIQNKAKFVTKKIQAHSGAANEAVVLVTDAATVMDATAVGEDGASAPGAVGDAVAGARVVGAGAVDTASASVVTVAAPSAQSNSEELTAFVAIVSAVESEAELKGMQRELMAEKRALRLEQKQRLAGQGKSGAQDPAEVEHAKELRRRIAEVTQKEAAVQKRVEQLLAASQATTGAAAAAGSAAEYVKTAKTAAAASSAELSALREQTAEVQAPTMASAGPTAIVNDQLVLYAKAEHMLKEGQHLLQWLAERGTATDTNAATATTSGSLTSPAPSLGFLNKSFGRSFAFSRSDEPTMLRRATLLAVESTQLAREIDPLRDPGGYADNLVTLCQRLKTGLAAPSMKEAQPTAPAVPSTATATSAPAVTAGIASGQHQESSVSAVHASASTSQLADAAKPAAAPDLLTSASTSRIPDSSPPKQISTAGAQQSTGVVTGGDSSGAPSVVISPENAAPAHENDMKTLVKGAEEVADNANDPSAGPPEPAEEGDESDGQEEDGEAEPAIVLEDLPGWEECLTTSMASAAHHAAFYGYSEVLDCLCKYFDCFVMDKKGRTPLFYAALQNRLNCVASLVSLDPQWIDVGDQNGDTALHAAAIANGVEVLSFLLQCEANPDTANYAGLTPCHLARTRAALEVLCTAGAMPYCVDGKSRMPLWFACSEGRGDCAEFLCSQTPAEYLLWPDEEGETALHRAAMNGHAQCVEALAQHLLKTEDLYVVNKKQHTAAHVASTAGVLKALFESGASLWIPDPKGRMPLFTASFFGRADCIAFLLDVASNSLTSVPAVSAGPKGESNKVPTDDRALVGAPDFQGDTPLHVACLCGHIRCVSLLLFFTQCTKNKQGLMPDQLATKAGHAQIAQMVAHVHQKRDSEGLSSMQIYGCEFSVLCGDAVLRLSLDQALRRLRRHGVLSISRHRAEPVGASRELRRARRGGAGSRQGAHCAAPLLQPVQPGQAGQHERHPAGIQRQVCGVVHLAREQVQRAGSLYVRGGYARLI
jgi:ankyrin repeat protein